MKNLLLFSVFALLAFAEFSCNEAELTVDSYDFEKQAKFTMRH